MISVLFVCTGNICRSPTAEGVFRHLVEDAGLEDEFLIASAGTESYHVGDPPDARSTRMAAKYGISLDGQKARHLNVKDYAAFNYIFAMDQGHFSIINTRAPKNANANIAMFLETGDVPDPWYGGEADFEHVYALVRDRCEKLLEKIRKDHKL